MKKRKQDKEEKNNNRLSIKDKINSIKNDVKNLKRKKEERKTINEKKKDKNQNSNKRKKNVEEKIIEIKEELTTKESKKSKNLDKMYVIPLGGLEEVGKNTTVFQYKDEIILVDAGAIFPDESLPGIDLVIPDYSFLENNKSKIKGVFVTHGHEDHIGGIPYLYEKIEKDTPIYSGKLTNALIKSKFENFDKRKKIPKMLEIGPRSKIQVGKYFTVEFIRVTHSIADSYCLSIKTPAGHVFHSGDFKIDLTPIDGERVDFMRLAELGEEGVDLMLSDSTNSEVEGFTPSERSVGDAFKQEFAKANGRIIIAVFASHVHRIQQIIDIATQYKRKVAIDGRSLVKIFEIAPTVGYLNIPENTLVPLSSVEKLDDDKVLIICTGTQGEPLAALSRIAKNMHKHIKLKEGDTVIISSTPIPGNEKAVSYNINNILRYDVDLVFKKIAGIHVSGHGSKEEQKLMLNLINPKYFMPVHGEYRMLKAHMKSAIETGVPKERVLITQNGDKIEVTKDYVKISGKVNSGDILIDGLGVGDIGNKVIKDRQQLSEDGIVIVAYSINKEDGKIIAGPELSTKGVVYHKDSEDIVKEALEILKSKIKENKYYEGKDWGDLKNNIKDIISRLFYEKFKRTPIVLPMFLEI
ncbi:MAG: ribonuclease J [Fusobacterium sp.]|uniref:ribonuclease J n=1 Tax=Fusobacterium sp. TaxID=68766 RepID=UPI0026DA92E0|nr:ribonuclease J [Fusobacterium sp.]MDO4691052.1 ribonuclease J [Fusobacterium sp.]